jgi:hypothetical protein
MNKIQEIQEQINAMAATIKAKNLELKAEAAKEFAKMMKSKADVVNAMVAKVETSKELTLSEFEGWPEVWARVDFEQLDLDLRSELVKDLLTEWFNDQHCMNVNFEHDILSMNCGPAILINEDGDILDQDSGKWVINHKDYETEEERNSLIEAYMEKNGYFPSVVRVDRYNNVFYVNTKK